MADDPPVELDSPGQNARVYWEMFGGLTGESAEIPGDLYIRAVDIDMEVGGHQADAYPYFRVSVYLRTTVEDPNLCCIYRELISREPGGAMWRAVTIRAGGHSSARCVVVRVEGVNDTWTKPPDNGYTRHYNDQYATADVPPWGIRITKASIYGSSLGRNVTSDRVINDILTGAMGGGMTMSTDGTNLTLDQCLFDALPKDRWEAIDDMVAMSGDNYVSYHGSEVHFSRPGHGTKYSLAYGDPRTTWSIDKNVDEQYGAVRVSYTNAKGKPREVVVHGGSGPRADYLTAPESVKTEQSARRLGERYLSAHTEFGLTGSVTIVGKESLSYRPCGQMNGENITSVTLNPLEPSASVQFGENSRRFDTFLARLAAGANIKRR